MVLEWPVVDVEVLDELFPFEGVAVLRDSAPHDITKGVLVVIEGCIAIRRVLESVSGGDQCAQAKWVGRSGQRGQ